MERWKNTDLLTAKDLLPNVSYTHEKLIWKMTIATIDHTESSTKQYAPFKVILNLV